VTTNRATERGRRHVSARLNAWWRAANGHRYGLLCSNTDHQVGGAVLLALLSDMERLISIFLYVELTVVVRDVQVRLQEVLRLQDFLRAFRAQASIAALAAAQPEFPIMDVD
jgi:hypothetical protein